MQYKAVEIKSEADTFEIFFEKVHTTSSIEPNSQCVSKVVEYIKKCLQCFSSLLDERIDKLFVCSNFGLQPHSHRTHIAHF